MLRHYVSYNRWANHIIVNFLHDISQEDFSEDMKNSFPSIQATVLHLYAAESVWLGRLKGNPDAPFPLFEKFPSKKESLDLWESTSKDFEKFMSTCTDDFATQSITYHRMEKVEQTEAKWILHHVMNHSTFHRGQIITMLRQLGYDDLPMTDFIKYQRLQ
ncbi:MAG: DinB family protein [Saprospiraceae bacterium]|nr:DinB family protein [Saprospiraceae bacterium]